MFRSCVLLDSGRRSREVVVAFALAACVASIPGAGVAQEQPANPPPRAAPGTQAGSLKHGGLTRTFLLHVPRSYRPGDAPPLIVALHGGTGTGLGMELISGLSAISDTAGFVVVYPDGVGRSWNDGRGLQSFQAMHDNIDDVGFIAALIDSLSEQYSVDRSRVYVTGISNGGHMSHRLGVELSDRIAAIAPVAASMPLSVSKSPAPSKPPGVIQFFGTEDRHNYWAGGGRAGGLALSVPDVMTWWGGANHCAAKPKVDPMPDLADDGTRIRREDYGPCASGAEVILYAIEGGGHNGAGWMQYRPVEEIGRTSRDLNSIQVMWEFFTRHRRGDPATLPNQ
jgi:polyhydroxybutyrate depolymerase